MLFSLAPCQDHYFIKSKIIFFTRTKYCKKIRPPFLKNTNSCSKLPKQVFKNYPMLSVVPINPNEAFELLKNNADSVLVDVRTFEEFNFVGTANPKEFNNRMILLPWQLMPTMEVNESFEDQLAAETKKLFGNKAQDAKIIFICRTGGRSYQAANQALMLGYKNCYNLTSGFEGDFNELGQRGKVNGWKAQSLPWRQK